VKVLLDENLDHALRKLLGQHEVVTVAYRGWAGLKNGELLKTAEDDGIDVFLTGDGTLSYEQNLTGRRLAIVALSAIQLPIIKQHLPKIIAPPRPVLFRAEIAARSPGRSRLAIVLRIARRGADRGAPGSWKLRMVSRILKGMEVHFPPVASANGKNAEQLVQDTVFRMLENQARFIAGVQRGIEQADRGELFTVSDFLTRQSS
jgi:hypothetical protein